MSAQYIRASRVVTPDGIVEDAAVLVEGERITSIGHAAALQPPQGAVVRGCDVLMPGFIDMHAHGAAGQAFGEGSDAARSVSRVMASNGVTTCYAGLGAGATLEAVAQTVAAAATATGETGGARLEGIFLEVPFISPAKKGAWTAQHLRTPDIAELRQLIAAAQGTLRRINVAPELPGALEFIREARRQGIVVSIGHSNATYDEAVRGIEAGATIANHTYNAMSGLDHRSPGMVGAILGRDGLLAELILDGIHVHPAAAAVLYRARGAAGVVLITDSSAMAGQPDGTYQAGHRTLTVKDGACRLPDGTLAGSIATFDQCVRNAAAYLGADLVALASISATNAARAMGIAKETGSITPGCYADLVLLNHGLEPQATIVRGSVVFERTTAAGHQP